MGHLGRVLALLFACAALLFFCLFVLGRGSTQITAACTLFCSRATCPRVSAACIAPCPCAVPFNYKPRPVAGQAPAFCRPRRGQFIRLRGPSRAADYGRLTYALRSTVKLNTTAAVRRNVRNFTPAVARLSHMCCVCVCV